MTKPETTPATDLYSRPARRYVHEGVDRYCSPWCGFHCTFANWREAQTLAGACARRLGHQWTPAVHENNGWHARAVFSGAAIFSGDHDPEPRVRAEVSVKTEPVFGSRRRRVLGYWANISGHGSQWHADGHTPNAALAGAIAIGAKTVTLQLAVLAALGAVDSETVDVLVVRAKYWAAKTRTKTKRSRP